MTTIAQAFAALTSDKNSRANSEFMNSMQEAIELRAIAKDQNWSAETTTYTFDDNSTLTDENGYFTAA